MKIIRLYGRGWHLSTPKGDEDIQVGLHQMVMTGRPAHTH